jgi:zinc transporter ZupT
MSPFFPESSFTASRVDSALRRVPRSLIPMALITGIVVHSYIWLVLARASTGFGWVALLLAFAGRFVLLLGLATVYLANHPVRQWIWKAPLFALAEGAVEALMVAALIAVRVERIGTEHAHRHDWVSIVADILLYHGIAILVFSLILALVVQTVRYALLKHEHRESTAIKIHEEHERTS